MLLVPGQSHFVCSPAHCSTDVPLTLPLAQGTLAGMTISSARGSGLAALGEGSLGMGPLLHLKPAHCLLLEGKKVALGTQKILSPFLSSPGILAPIHVAGSR